MGSVEDKVRLMVKNISKVEDDIGLGDYLIQDLGLDSIDRMDLFMNIEDEFDIKISYKEEKAILKVQDIVNLIKKMGY